MKSEEKIKTWINERSVVHPHQPAENYGPHTALFHPALARLKHRLKSLDEDFELSARHLEWAHKYLIACANGHKTEKDQESELKGIIGALIGEDAVWQGRLKTGTAIPDAAWGKPIRMIMELKNYDGVNGSATLQALLDYAKHLEILEVCPLHLLKRSRSHVSINRKK